MTVIEFLKEMPKDKTMNEGAIIDNRIMVLGMRGSVRYVVLKDCLEPVGAAWKDRRGVWHATMGTCWVGTYKSWDHALGNILVAYFG